MPDSIKVTTLDSGLRVASDTMGDVASAVVGIWAGAGARGESPKQNGIAHLLEHMLFKGTSTRSATQISEQIENVGGHLNAYTGYECTAYYSKILGEDLALAVDILADMLQHSVFDPAEMTREQSVIVQEIGRNADTPDDVVYDHFQATCYPEQSLGRSVLGSIDTVCSLKRDDLFGYLQHHYGSGNIVIAAAGRVDHDELVGRVAHRLEQWPYPWQHQHQPASYRGGELRQERELEQVHLILGFHALNRHDQDIYAQAGFSAIIGQGASSRLFQEIREKRGLVYSVHSFSSAYQDDGTWGVYAGTGAESLPELIPVLCEQLATFADKVTETEVDRARTLLRARTLMAQESVMGRCERLGQQLLLHGRVIPLDEIVERISAVDRPAVQRVAGRILGSTPALAALGPLQQLEPLTTIQQRLN